MGVDVLFSGIREFGLAIMLVLAGATSSFMLIRSMRADYKELQGELKVANSALFELSKSSLTTIHDLSRIANELSPAIAALGTTQKEHLEDSIKELKTHLDHKLELLHKILDDK